MLAQLKLSAGVVFVVAGWIKYLQEEKGAELGSGAGADAGEDDDEVGATPGATLEGGGDDE